MRHGDVPNAHSDPDAMRETIAALQERNAELEEQNIAYKKTVGELSTANSQLADTNAVLTKTHSRLMEINTGLELANKALVTGILSLNGHILSHEDLHRVRRESHEAIKSITLELRDHGYGTGFWTVANHYIGSLLKVNFLAPFSEGLIRRTQSGRRNAQPLAKLVTSHNKNYNIPGPDLFTNISRRPKDGLSSLIHLVYESYDEPSTYDIMRPRLITFQNIIMSLPASTDMFEVKLLFMGLSDLLNDCCSLEFAWCLSLLQCLATMYDTVSIFGDCHWFINNIILHRTCFEDMGILGKIAFGQFVSTVLPEVEALKHISERFYDVLDQHARVVDILPHVDWMVYSTEKVLGLGAGAGHDYYFVRNHHTVCGQHMTSSAVASSTRACVNALGRSVMPEGHNTSDIKEIGFCVRGDIMLLGSGELRDNNRANLPRKIPLIVSCIGVSLYRLVLTLRFSQTLDWAYDNYPLALWSAIVLDLVIMCASGPASEPGIKIFFPRLRSKRSHDCSNTYNKDGLKVTGIQATTAIDVEDNAGKGVVGTVIEVK
ncbi:Hypothetical protein D9617_18g032660 [Elsinoe fawcettii]|nr:Hypothetical protein D9617_18g032660 [Elsinoe fawcettii]